RRQLDGIAAQFDTGWPLLRAFSASNSTNRIVNCSSFEFISLLPLLGLGPDEPDREWTAVLDLSEKRFRVVPDLLGFFGGPLETRTPDPLIKSRIYPCKKQVGLRFCSWKCGDKKA